MIGNIFQWLGRARRSARAALLAAERRASLGMGKSPAFGPSDARRSNQLAFDPDAPYALCGRPQLSTFNSQPLRGFSLIEVMVAMFVFFIVVFAILGMVVQSVGAARALQKQHADCGLVAAQFSLSNTLEEGSYSGDFEGIVPDYTWNAEVFEAGSNGFFQIDIAVHKKGASGKDVGETMSMLKFTGQKSKAPGSLRR